MEGGGEPADRDYRVTLMDATLSTVPINDVLKVSAGGIVIKEEGGSRRRLLGLG